MKKQKNSKISAFADLSNSYSLLPPMATAKLDIFANFLYMFEHILDIHN